MPNEEVEARARTSVYQCNSATIYARASAEEEEERQRKHHENKEKEYQPDYK